MARYSAKGLPWAHGIGKDVKDCTTSREVMEKAGLNWTVNKCQLVAKMPFNVNSLRLKQYEPSEDSFSYGGNIYKDLENAFATYRTDINAPLGLVKQKYEIVQNNDVFTFFDSAIGQDKAVWQTAGMLGYGHKIFVTAKLPVTTTVLGEPIDNYLVFSNSHDGSSSVDIQFTPVRVFCTNCLNAAFKSANCHIRLRHTKTIAERLELGADVLKIACQYALSAKEIYDSLAAIKMTDKQVMEYIANLQLTDDELAKIAEIDNLHGIEKLFARNYRILEESGISTRKSNQIATMFDYYQNGVAQEKIVGTAWGAYNAITGYYSNVANLEGTKRLDSLLWGSANNTMNRALNLVAEYEAA